MTRAGRRCAVALWLTTTILPAQAVVLPPECEAHEGNNLDGTLLAQGDGRRQWLVANVWLLPLLRDGTWQVRELWFRRDMTVPRPASGGALDVELWASATDVAPAAASADFASNRGADHRLRCRTRLVVPDLRRGGPVPAPWEEREGRAVRLLLDPPVAGRGHLCLELVTRTPPDQPLPAYNPDAQLSAPPRLPRPFGSSCSWGGLAPRAAALEDTLVPGGTAVLQLTQVPPGRLALGLLDFGEPCLTPGAPSIDPGGTQDCTPALAGAPAVAVATVASPVDPGAGAAERRVPVPLDGALLGARLASQWLVLEPGANAAGAIASHGLVVALAGSLFGSGITTLAAADPEAAAGQLVRHMVTVLRLVR